MKKHCCKECHFLSKDSDSYVSMDSDPNSLSNPWDKEERDNFWPRYNREGDPHKVQHHEYYRIRRVGCYKAIWAQEYDEHINGSLRESLKNPSSELD